MKQNSSTKIEKLINEKSADNTQINNFIKASEEYQRLLKDGLTKKRGFNILTTEEIYNPILKQLYIQSGQ